MDENIFHCWRCGTSQDYEGTCDWCLGEESGDIDTGNPEEDLA